MKLLLIMPKFFDYPEVISEELNKMGYEVDFFDDRPGTSGFIKAIIKIRKELINNYIRRYFEKMMETVRSKKYDIVFLISGQSLSLSEDMIRQIKKCQPQAYFVLYQWDSLNNFPYIARMQKYFDKCYSFDRTDCEKNDNLKFLSLFYSSQYENIGKCKADNYRYDFCFVGTAHPQKYKFINEMSVQLKKVYPKQFIYFYFPSRLVYFYRKFRNPELRKAHYSEFHYVPISRNDMNELFLDSRCILDSPQAGQLGLTMRVLETFGAKKKLITTNVDIKNYDFFREENVYVYEGKFDLDAPFFKEPYKEVEQEIYEKYSLRNWLSEILDKGMDK